MKTRLFIIILSFFFIQNTFSQFKFWDLSFGMSKENVIKILKNKGYQVAVNDNNIVVSYDVYFENFFFQRCTFKFSNNRLVVCRLSNFFKKEDLEIYLKYFNLLEKKFCESYGDKIDLTNILKTKSIGWNLNNKGSNLSLIIQTNKEINLLSIIFIEDKNKEYSK